jgi:DNA-binding NarL/FixJ family response regulator
MNTGKDTRIVIVDDHKLFRKGMLELVNGFAGYSVIWEAENGKDFTQKLSSANVPDIVLLDISMPVMDGFQTAEWLADHYPDVKTLALSMHNDDESIMKMLKAGVNGYILKNTDPAELKVAFNTLETEGTYYTGRIASLAIKSLSRKNSIRPDLQEREIEFLKLACTELPYKSFAPFLKVHPRVVESIRETLFRKLEVESRVGLVKYAIKHGIYVIE